MKKKRLVFNGVEFVFENFWNPFQMKEEGIISWRFVPFSIAVNEIRHQEDCKNAGKVHKIIGVVLLNLSFELVFEFDEVEEDDEKPIPWWPS